MEIRLYGELGKLASEFDDETEKIGIVEFEVDSPMKISDVLECLEIEEDEVSHLFLDGVYSDFERKIPEDSERLAIFPRDMGVLYKWYFSAKK